MKASEDNALEKVPAAEETPADPQALIAEAAHELRLPIANIKLLVETLLDGALDDREVTKRMLKRAYQEVERLQLLVQDMLSLEQIAKQRDELNFQWVPLVERARYASEAVAKRAAEKGISVSIDVPPDCHIWANRDQLDQVLLNLMENAVKFTPDKGSVSIKSGKPGCFTVSDSGIGIPAHEIPKIFSRFYRVDKSSARGGTGLGLSIVKQVLDLHGAKISVDSAEGKGSSFSLEFTHPVGRTLP